ncbi:Conserved_hypothetical protein [Hexamita inflata]|uniref:Uncharacterized protein n=1 Tax=Hexamita inflata TaxID=28002 RepID=A0AA86QGW5_9EUKA|nr:Conserved hypothetical protein [Hexamita inflata]
MSYMRTVRPQKPQTFDCSPFFAQSYQEVGVRFAPAAHRRDAINQRNSPLIPISAFDFRSNKPIVSGQLPPTTTPNNLVLSIRCSSAVKMKDFATPPPNRTRSPNRYFGPNATGAEYKRIRPEPLQQLPSMISEGTKRSKTGQFRDQVEVKFEHGGAFTQINGVEMWSCCGCEEKNGKGCGKKERHVGKNMYEWTPNTIVR